MKTIEDAYRRFSDKRFALPAEEQVTRLEQQIGITFPEDFRRYVLAFNGGYFNEPDITPSQPECPLDRLTALSGIGAPDDFAELASEENLAIFDDNDPPEIVPIGHTLMGNLIVLVTRPEERGSILLKQARSDTYFLLAPGIEAFFGLLREPSNE